MTNREKYIDFCNREKNIPVFSKYWWLDSLCGEKKWDVILIEKKGEIIASFPFFKDKNWFMEAIQMPKLTQCLGPYIKYPENQKYEKKLSFEKDIMNSIINELPAVKHLNINFHYSITNWLPFYWKGFKQTTRYTYVIKDMDNLENVFSNISSSYRNKIRKAIKLVEVKEDLDIEQFYILNAKVFQRQKIKVPYSLELVKKHDKCLSKNNSRKIFYAIDVEGNIHSSLYITWDINSAYLHMVGEDPEYRKSGAGILLIWEAIKYTFEKLGLRNFDFEGSMIEGVESVRRAFGAKQVSYFNISKTAQSVTVLKEMIGLVKK